MAVVNLDTELDQLQAVDCRRCGHGYPTHEEGGGHCRGHLGGWSSPARGIPCMCPGFRWVDPEGPPLSYDGRPTPSASE